MLSFARRHALALGLPLLLFCEGVMALPTKPRIALAPKNGQRTVFVRNYREDTLKNHPLQLVKKTEFSVENQNGMLVGIWKATFRDIRNDEEVVAEAKGICRAAGSRKLDCAFNADQGSVSVTAQADGILVSVPVGQGVRFDEKTEEGPVWAEILLGTDDDNNRFKLYPKKISRR